MGALLLAQLTQRVRRAMGQALVLLAPGQMVSVGVTRIRLERVVVLQPRKRIQIFRILSARQMVKQDRLARKAEL